jgi:hypothetical protein
MHMTGTLQQIIEAGRLQITAIAYHDGWGEIDSERDLLASADTARPFATGKACG